MRDLVCRTILTTGLIVLGTAASGCANRTGEGASDATYRTVVAEPLRDTEAAKRANRAGLKHLEAGDLDKAAAAFERALTEDVEFGPAHNNLGKVHHRRKDWYEAAWEFEYARSLMPKRAEPCNNLALVLEATGQLDGAIERYRQAVELDGDTVEYRANLARALVRRGDRSGELRRLLDDVLEHDTRPDWLTWARRQRSLLGDVDW